MSPTLPPRDEIEINIVSYGGGVLSVPEIRRRLRIVWAESRHLKYPLPVDNAHNRILTLHDIAHFVKGEPARRLLQLSAEPPVGEELVKWRRILPSLQRRLSDFFTGWDAGTLVKARIGDGWTIINRHAPLAPLDAQASSQADARPAIACQADFATGSLRIR